MSGVHNWSSGSPLTFTMGTDVALDGTGGAGRQLAQLARARRLTTSSGIMRAAKTWSTRSSTPAAFAPVASLPRGIYGNVPKGAISGPAAAKTDIAVARSFRIPGSQGVRLQFRGELFNAFNQVNFSVPLSATVNTTAVSTSASAANFGRITTAADPRIGQVAIKLLW